MANQKAGLDYFALDTDIELDDKIALIEAKHGAVGFTVVIKLFLKIYGDKGYYYEWNEQSALIFSRRSNINYEVINDVVKDAIEFELFDKKMYEKYKILTSKRIQEHYLEATKRRKIVEFFKPFLLLNGQNVNIKRENVYILTENDDILKQSKVKESKVKESKEDIDVKINYSEFITLTKKEYKKLIDKYGELNTKKFIDKLNNWKGSKGKKTKSDYFTILDWVVEAVIGADKKKQVEADYKAAIQREKQREVEKEIERKPPPPEVMERINKIIKPIDYERV